MGCSPVFDRHRLGIVSGPLLLAGLVADRLPLINGKQV